MVCTNRSVVGIFAVAGLAMGTGALAQPWPVPARTMDFRADSGRLADAARGSPLGREPARVWVREITVAGAPVMRVHFGRDTVLAGKDRHHGGSYLVITSVQDGAKHYLDAATLPEWDYISAFMNGESVFVELYAVPGMGENRATIQMVTAGEATGGPDTICGTTDDRVPYNDPRLGRLSTGCTGWMISANGASNEYLTAGHCISNGQAGAVMMFNVPPATAAGGFVAPPPEFQFPVQSASIQSLNNAAVGDEFARFNTSNNSNTGLPSRIAQGRGAFILAGSAPASGTAATTVRGNGIVNDQAGIPAVPLQWQRINKTDTGPYAGKVGTRINYSVDTENANSGSPVTQRLGFPLLLELAIGIHTDGFCPGTFNSGTAIDHPGLQAALASPSGDLFPYNSAVSKGLNTTLASDNGGSDGGSIFFDVTTGVQSVKVTSINLNINRNGTTNNGTATEDDDFFNFEVFITPGTAVGKQTNQGLWTKVADGAGMPKFEDEYTLGALKDTFVLNGSQSYGMAIVFDNGAGHAYTNGTGSNETYSNADLTITGISASNTPFGSIFSGRVFNGGLNYELNQSSGQCLETIYAQNNNGSNGGIVYFNVAVGSQPVTLTGLSTNVEGAGGLNCNLILRRAATTYVGKETNSNLWTQVATAAGTSSAVDTPSHFALSNFVTLNANTSYGFSLEMTTSGASEGHAYTNGNGMNQVYADGKITITTGAAANVPFTAPIFSPRVWNGSLCYGIGLNTCSNSLVTQAPPNADLGGFNSVPGGQEEADNFAVGQNWSVTGGTFWAAYSTPATPPVSQDLVIRFFADNNGVPGNLVATRNVNNVPVLDTGLIMGPFNKPIYQYNTTFAAVNLPPGQYWVSALGNEAGYTWAWARTNALANAHAVRQGAGAWNSSAGDFAFVLCGQSTPVACYPNCDGSTVPPILNVNDFICFQQKYAANDPYANCDGSTVAPVLNVNDFICFQQKYAAGCP